jgi:uncharacterized phage-associated protein
MTSDDISEFHRLLRGLGVCQARINAELAKGAKADRAKIAAAFAAGREVARDAAPYCHSSTQIRSASGADGGVVQMPPGGGKGGRGTRWSTPIGLKWGSAFGRLLAFGGIIRSNLVPYIQSFTSRRVHTMANSATAVANRFLELAAHAGKSLTPLQLIKLTYLAYAWNLELTGKRLFEEQPQAWQYGPVIPSLYHKVKSFRDQPIIGALPADWFGSGQSLSAQEQSVIDQVFKAYAGFSGIQLSSMTHQPGAPWFEVWHSMGKNAPIPDPLIKSHYEEIRRTRSAKN